MSIYYVFSLAFHSYLDNINSKEIQNNAYIITLRYIIILYIYIYIFTIKEKYGGARGVMVIVVGNGHGDTS